MSTSAFSIPAVFRRGNYGKDEEKEVKSAVQLIQLICQRLGVANLASVSLLDIGCGCKLVQAILNHNFPIGRYVGIDVYAELIQFLQSNVSDPRFSFHPFNAQNEMYNAEGEPLSANTQLPLEEHSFDVISLFSVFTHLAPHDYVAMLHMLRRYIKPQGKVIFSLFVNETTNNGLGYVDHWTKSMSARTEIPDSFRNAVSATTKEYTVPDFLDAVPSQPLKIAMYSRENALQLVQGTGWEVESLNDPEEAIQHYMICRPV
jgi:SAM-dependent methyltransferase